MNSKIYLLCFGYGLAFAWLDTVLVSGQSTATTEGSTPAWEPFTSAPSNGSNDRHWNQGFCPFTLHAKAGLFEGDILGVNPMTIVGRNGLLARKWTDNRLPYEISPGFSAAQISVINSAITEINSQLEALRLVPRSGRADQNYVAVEPGAPGSGCSTFVGMIGGKQILNLEAANPCFGKGTILHDFMHAMGFWHEQSRTDRDLYIDINFNNVNNFNRTYNFQKYTNPVIGDVGEPYDIDSMMHYERNSFAINGNIPTVRPKPPHQNDEMGQKKALSPGDIKKINRMYPASRYGKN